MKITRKEFISSAAAFAVSPMLSADGRRMKTPLMLDTKRIIYGPFLTISASSARASLALRRRSGT